MSVEKELVLHFLHDAIGLKDSRHLFIQSEVKPKPIVTRSHAFSRALRQPHVITSSFDWFNVLSVSYVIGQSNYFGFGFTTLKRKPLYELYQNAFIGTRLITSRMHCKPELCRENRSAEICCKLILQEQTIFKCSIDVVSSDC